METITIHYVEDSTWEPREYITTCSSNYTDIIYTYVQQYDEV